MFVSRIKELRMQRKISQDLIAKFSKISQMGISYIEMGKRSPSLNTLEKIFEALNELDENICIYELFEFKCKKHDDCTKLAKPYLNCYMDIKYRKDPK